MKFDLKKPKQRRLFSLFLLAAVLAVGGFFIYRYFTSPERKLDEIKQDLPSPQSGELGVGSKVPLQTPLATRPAGSIPAELNLDVPFTSQAPAANWDKTHEEACEEAALLMANRFFNNQSIDSPEDAERGLQQIIDWEMQNLGFFESTTAEETARVAREMLGLKTEIVKNPTVDDIKQALSEGKLVVVPAAGRELGNPFYKQPGPLYHYLLIKGYTKTQFITNDAGTKHGENYPYNYDVVMNANHDWNGGDVGAGARVIILVSK